MSRKIELLIPAEPSIAESTLFGYLKQAHSYEDAKVIFHQVSKNIKVLAKDGKTVDNYVRRRA